MNHADASFNSGIFPDSSYWAWSFLKNKWSSLIFVYLVPIFFSFISIFVSFGEYVLTDAGDKLKVVFDYDILFDILLGGVMAFGISKLSLSIIRKEDYHWGMVFSGFNKYFKYFAAYLLSILVIVLFALLLIVPGIIVGLQLSLVFYIMADDSEIGIFDALTKSKSMMYGYKWRLFKMLLFFFFCFLLCLATLGIGLFFLIPWYNISMAKFYDEIKMQERSIEEEGSLVDNLNAH